MSLTRPPRTFRSKLKISVVWINCIDERLKAVSSATVKRDLVIVSHLFEVARKEWGCPVANPVRDIKTPAHNKARERRLESASDGSESEEKRLL